MIAMRGIMARKSYSLYLAKQDLAGYEQLLSENATARLAEPQNINKELPDFADGGRLLIFIGRSDSPPWYREIRHKFELDGNIPTQSASGLLIFRKADQNFVVTFAHGWMFLNDRYLERDFGLRVCINALDETKLKRLERTNLGDALKASALSPFQRDFESFGIDDALDLVRTLSGATRDDVSADALTGSYSLKINGEIEIEDLPVLAEEALTLFSSNAYQNTAFRVLDMLRPVTDRVQIENLDNQVIQHVVAQDGSFELGLPGHNVDEAVAYSFVGPGLRGQFSDLLIQHYAQSLGGRLNDLDTTMLHQHKILARYEEVGLHDRSWSIHRGLVGSITNNNRLYAINDGLWYNVDEAFKLSIEDSYQELVEDWGNPPIPFRKIFDESGRNSKYETEVEYNQSTAASLGFLFMDRKLISIPEIPRSGFEACDILDLEGKRFIHVKKSSRQSSVLSHFFKQAGNSGTNFQRFSSCWDALRAIILADFGLPQAVAFDAARDDDRKWKVEFWIADTERAVGGHNIPFFSKISLRSEIISLRAMNYDIGLKFIGMQPH
jgi:uncharacterized protein (TIGR04141 family)